MRYSSTETGLKNAVSGMDEMTAYGRDDTTESGAYYAQEWHIFYLGTAAGKAPVAVLSGFERSCP